MLWLASTILVGLTGVALAADSGSGSGPDHSKHNAVQLDESLVKSCDFRIGGHHFKLCPMFEGDWKSRFKYLQWEEQTPPTVTKTTYKMSLGGPLRFNNTLPEHEQCPPGTWICKTVTNTRPEHRSEAARVLQVVPVAGDIDANKGSKDQFGVFAQFGQSWSQRPDDDLPPLWIRMHGGSYVDQPQRALINFVCNDTVHDTDPRFIATYKGTHFFSWTSAHSCSHLHQANKGGNSKPNPGRPATPPSDIESPEDLLPPDMSVFPSRTTTSIILTILAAILLLTYIILRPPPLLRRLLSPFAAPVARQLRRSRYSTFNSIGESKLLRWAQEDLAIQGDDDYSDDLAGGSGSAWFAGGGRGGAGGGRGSEEIPLTPSPKKMFADYGTATR